MRRGRRSSGIPSAMLVAACCLAGCSGDDGGSLPDATGDTAISDVTGDVSGDASTDAADTAVDTAHDGAADTAGDAPQDTGVDATDDASPDAETDPEADVEVGVDVATDIGADGGGGDESCPADVQEIVLPGSDEAPISVAFDTTGLTSNTIPDRTASGCEGAAADSPGLGGEQIFAFTAPGEGWVEATTTDTAGFDTMLYARAEGCADGVQVACNDDALPGVYQSLLRIPVQEGERYWLFVDGYAESSWGAGTVQVSFRSILGPGDTCPAAEVPCAEGLRCRDGECVEAAPAIVAAYPVWTQMPGDAWNGRPPTDQLDLVISGRDDDRDVQYAEITWYDSASSTLAFVRLRTDRSRIVGGGDGSEREYFWTWTPETWPWPGATSAAVRLLDSRRNRSAPVSFVVPQLQRAGDACDADGSEVCDAASACVASVCADARPVLESVSLVATETAGAYRFVAVGRDAGRDLHRMMVLFRGESLYWDAFEPVTYGADGSFEATGVVQLDRGLEFPELTTLVAADAIGHRSNALPVELP